MAATDVRLTVYDPTGQTILALDASPDLAGGGISVEDTPSGCGAGKITHGLYFEQIRARGYWAGMNLVEISAGDMRLAQSTAAVSAGGTLKVYLDSTFVIDPAQGEDNQVLYFATTPGAPATLRCPVQSVGADGGGQYAIVGTPLHGGGIPAFSAGAIVGRRIYFGRIVRRSGVNDFTPTGDITLVGLSAAFAQAIGTFTISAAASVDVATAIYESLQQFASRFPFFHIYSTNFPATGATYSGSETDVGLDRWFSDCLTGISNGDQWVVRVGHDLTPRIVKLYSASSNTYSYTINLSQTGVAFVPLSVTVDDEDTSQLYNSIEVIGDTDPLTQQPVKAISQDATSIADLGVQIDGAPVTNTGCKTVAQCASYGLALLEQNAIPRSQNQFMVYLDDDAASAAGPGGASRGGIVRALANIVTTLAYNGTTDQLYGLGSSITRAIDIAGVKDFQTVHFAAIEPDWRAFMRQRNAGLAAALQANTSTKAGFAGYYTDTNSWPEPNGPPSSGLVVSPPKFFAQFAPGTSPVQCGGNTFTLPANATSFVWLNPNNTWTVLGADTVVAGGIPYGAFMTSAAAVLGEIRRVPIGPLIPASNVAGIANQNLIIDSDQAAGVVFDLNSGNASSKGSPSWKYSYIGSTGGMYLQRGGSANGANPLIVADHSAGHPYQATSQSIKIPAASTAWISCYFDGTGLTTGTPLPTFSIVDASNGTVYATASAVIGTNNGTGPNGRCVNPTGFTPSVDTEVVAVFKMNGAHLSSGVFVFSEPQLELGALPSPYKRGPLVSNSTNSLTHATMSAATQSLISDDGSGNAVVSRSTAFRRQGSVLPIGTPSLSFTASDSTGNGNFQIEVRTTSASVYYPDGGTPVTINPYDVVFTTTPSGGALTAQTTYYFAYRYNPSTNNVEIVAGPQIAAINQSTIVGIYADGYLPVIGSVNVRTPLAGGSPITAQGGGGFGGRPISQAG